MSGHYAELEHYIQAYWDKLRVEHIDETKTALGLPRPYYAPSTEAEGGFSFPHMYYWDSYFIAQGFWGTEREPAVYDLLENMLDMIRRFSFVPNSNSFSHLSRSQPPLLAKLIKQCLDRDSHGNDWLFKVYTRLKEEYEVVWRGETHPHHRQVFSGLSRYYDTNVLHVLAEAESGWDFTTRFQDVCLDFLPIDLNSLLFIYESVLIELAERVDPPGAEYWRSLRDARQRDMWKLMWHEDDGFYYDYNYRREEQARVRSLAAYAAMFSGVASREHAERMVEHLTWFETEHGLTTTAISGINHPGKQWTSPNGWAPLHDIVVDGLERYGYFEEAQRIRQKWVRTVWEHFQRTGRLEEKYNMMRPFEEGSTSVYPPQHGFGWTNGVTYKFIQALE